MKDWTCEKEIYDDGKRAGFRAAARLARKEAATISRKSYLFNYAHNEAEKVVQEGYRIACRDIARELARRGRGKP